jgi:OOP family OmpA-OmpF porin
MSLRAVLLAATFLAVGCVTPRAAIVHDQDGDGVPDEKDECPLDAEEHGGDGDGCPDAPTITLESGRIHIRGKVVFDVASAELLPKNGKLLAILAKLLNEHPELKRVEIQGHTDTTGEDEFNQQLSVQRAERVRQALIENGVDQGRLLTKGLGKSMPIASNDTEVGRAQNRRVEFHVLQ